MIRRIQNLDKRVPITFIYGQDTWMDRSIGEMVKGRLNNFVRVEVIFFGIQLSYIKQLFYLIFNLN